MEPQTPAAKARARRSPGKRGSPGKQPDRQGEQSDSPGNQSPGNQDDRQGSPGSSTVSEPAASSPFGLRNPGRPFEGRESAPPADAGQPGQPEPALMAPLAWWDSERAAKVLRGQGVLTHALVGVADDDWKWRDGELEAVAPPLADGLNRVDILRGLAPWADAIGGVLGLAGYVQRSRAQRAQALANRPAPQPEPVTGVDAEGVSWRASVDQAATNGAAPDPARDARRQAALDGVMERGHERITDEPTDIDWRTE